MTDNGHPATPTLDGTHPRRESLLDPIVIEVGVTASYFPNATTRRVHIVGSDGRRSFYLALTDNGSRRLRDFLNSLKSLDDPSPCAIPLSRIGPKGEVL